MEEKILEFENWIKEKLEDPYNFVEETVAFREVLNKFYEIFDI